eukprot:535852_1
MSSKFDEYEEEKYQQIPLQILKPTELQQNQYVEEEKYQHIELSIPPLSKPLRNDTKRVLQQHEEEKSNNDTLSNNSNKQSLKYVEYQLIRSKCICGAKLTETNANSLYRVDGADNVTAVPCSKCKGIIKLKQATIVYHCTEDSNKHENGYVLCADCIKHSINVNSFNKPPTVEKTNKLCLYYKYRSEYIMNHRKERYNIILIPVYIIFIIFSVFISLIIHNGINTTTISYTNRPITTQFRPNITRSELESIKQCEIDFADIYGYFDALSFDFARINWNDYSIYKNHIKSPFISNKIKLGTSDDDNSLYIYGSKFDSIQIPPILNLNKTNYTIITIARYNGNDRDTIFTSNDGEWIFGFKNNTYNTIPTYHHHCGGNSTIHSTEHTAITDEWIINVDSPNIFRSQQQTFHENININATTDYYLSCTDSIKWGINILNRSEWAISVIAVFKHQLSFSQIECMENILINKYKILLSETTNNSTSDITKPATPTMHECARWKKGFDSEYIISWYDVNNGLYNKTLFDFSRNSNHILLDENIKIGIDENNKDFHYLYGSTNDSISISTPIKHGDNFWTAIYYVARYNGNDKGSILSDISSKFLCGFYQGSSGVCYWNEQRLSEFANDVYDDQWVLSSLLIENPYLSNDLKAYYCTQNCDTSSSFSNFRSSDIILNLVVNGENNTDWA